MFLCFWSYETKSNSGVHDVYFKTSEKKILEMKWLCFDLKNVTQDSWDQIYQYWWIPNAKGQREDGGMVGVGGGWLKKQEG